MRPRTLLLFVVALSLAVGTAVLTRSWFARQAAEAAAFHARVIPARSILVARKQLSLGHILKAQDLTWQVWPQGQLAASYVVLGTRPISAFNGWVTRYPITAGEPITEQAIVAPGNRGFLAAALRPGMRAVSVPITVTTGISGFVFPGDRVDLLVTYPVPIKDKNGKAIMHKAAETVLRDVRVIGIDQKLDSKKGEAIVAHTATLEVTPKQSEIIAVASQMGQLSLSLRSLVRSPDHHELADSLDGKPAETYTLDSQVSPLIPKPMFAGDNSEPTNITILRGDHASVQPVGSQPRSRGL